MELTSAQRSFLRSGARRLGAGMTIGRAGAGPNVLRHLRRLLASHELVKVHLLPGGAEDRAEVARRLARDSEAELVDLIGGSVVLYRPNDRLPPEKRIVLPER